MSSSIFVITPGILKEEKEYAFLELRAKVQKKGSFNLIPVIGFSREVSILKAIFDLWSWVWMQNYKKKIRTYYLVCIGLENYVHIRKKSFFEFIGWLKLYFQPHFSTERNVFCPLKKPSTPLHLTCNYVSHIWFWLHCVHVTLEISNTFWGDNITVLLWLRCGGAAVWKLCFVEVPILKVISSFLQLL